MNILFQLGVLIFSILSLGAFVKKRGCIAQFVYLTCAFCGYLILSNVAPLFQEEMNFWFSMVYFASSLASVAYFAFSSLKSTFGNTYENSSAKNDPRKKLLSVDQFLNMADSLKKQEEAESSLEDDLINRAVIILEKVRSK